MIDLLKLEKDFILPHIKKGGVCVDFTCGNGNDTLFLAQNIGPNGKVYAFDIQEQAINNTKKLLTDNNITNVNLIHDSHEFVKKYVPEKICVGMFNLGFLPGGDKNITTKHNSTLECIVSALELLCNDGAILIAVYPGHEEGTIEGNLIREHLKYVDRHVFCCSEFHIVNSPTSPFFYLIEKSDKKEKEKIAISACLLGDNVRYDGKRKPIDIDLIRKLRLKYDLIRICPETLGNLPIPRLPSERVNDLVLAKDGKNVTDNFILGADRTLKIIKDNGIKKAIMKKRSPSCGLNEIYDGTFSGKIVAGNGVTVELLLKNKIKIYTEDDIEKLLNE